jgi:hypothetical protein
MSKIRVVPEPKNLASVFRGVYSRVASRLNVDPSYVSRVARGERQSDAIESALERETTRLIQKLSHNGFGFNHNGSRNGSHNGAGRHSRKSVRSRKPH